VGVDLGRAHVPVAELLLHGADVHAAFQQVSGEGVTQRVTGGRLLDPESAGTSRPPPFGPKRQLHPDILPLSGRVAAHPPVIGRREKRGPAPRRQVVGTGTACGIDGNLPDFPDHGARRKLTRKPFSMRQALVCRNSFRGYLYNRWPADGFPALRDMRKSSVL
jgi:hypothetical protein